MSTKCHYTVLILIVGMIPLASAAKPGIFKGHPYHDPHSSIQAHSPAAGPISGLYSTPNAATFPPPAAHLEAYANPQPFDSPSSPTGFALGARAPQVANALLRVWVDDRAIVWVNGKRTKPQTLAGIHSGSRIFSLTGLVPDQIQEAVVHVQFWNGTPIEERELVQAGGSYEIRFPQLAIFEEEVQPLLPPRIDPFADDPIDTESAVKKAEDAAKKSVNEAARAKKTVDDAMAIIDKHLKEMRTLVAAARKSAKMAAQANSATFEFLDNDKTIVAWVKYNNDGSLAELHFDGPTTRPKLTYKGVTAHLHAIEVKFNYQFTIQIPDPSDPATFKDDKSFEIPGETSAIFGAGARQVDFFNRADPDQHLSAKFKVALMAHWSKRYHGGRVKVDIRAILPDGSEASVASVGKPIIIELRTD